jgi:hypothetical protein
MPASLEMEMWVRFFGLTCPGIDMRIYPPVIFKLYESTWQIERTHHPNLGICLPGKDVLVVFCYFPQVKFKMYICPRDITSIRMQALISGWRYWSAVSFAL